jgi:succinate dehydrogenase / fumarate reductase cytochrome b subunit
MNLIGRVFGSTIGKKLIVGITGVGLFAFVLQHMLGHLQMFVGWQAYNHYAESMQALGALKWGVRGVLLVGVVLHIWATVSLTRKNRAARPESYQVNKNTAASLASRTMIVSGLVLLAFIVYHLAQFTFGWTDPPVFALKDELGQHDVYAGMVTAFRNPAIAGFYIFAMGLLCMHLSHGVASFFRSLGLMDHRYRKLSEQFAVVAALVVFLGFVSVPLGIIAGVIQ